MTRSIASSSEARPGGWEGRVTYDLADSQRRAWSVLNCDSKTKLVEVMTSAAQEMIVAVREVTATRASVTEAIPQPRAEMAALRNGFKAAMYLFAIFIQVAEKNTKEAAIAGAGGARGAKKGKVRARKVSTESHRSTALLPTMRLLCRPASSLPRSGERSPGLQQRWLTRATTQRLPPRSLARTPRVRSTASSTQST